MLNQQIPEANRPIGAKTYADWGYYGEGSSLKIRFTLIFDNGIETRCANWDPAGEFPDSEKLGNSRCKFPEDNPLGEALGFKAGERVEIEYGSYEQLMAYGFGDSVAYQSVGGSLKLKLDGTIGNSRTSESYQSDSDVLVNSGKNKSIAGRYYLNGHTITIHTDQGDVVHGFIGYDLDRDGAMRRVYYNGSKFWDRKR